MWTSFELPAEAAVVEVLEACVKAWPDLHHHRLCVEVYFLSAIREQQKYLQCFLDHKTPNAIRYNIDILNVCAIQKEL